MKYIASVRQYESWMLWLFVALSQKTAVANILFCLPTARRTYTCNVFAPVLDLVLAFYICDPSVDS